MKIRATHCNYHGCKKALTHSHFRGKDQKYYCDRLCGTRGIRYSKERAITFSEHENQHQSNP